MKKTIISALIASSSLSMISPAVSSQVLVQSMPDFNYGAFEYKQAPVNNKFDLQRALDTFLYSFNAMYQKKINEANKAAIAQALSDFEAEEQMQIANDAAIAQALSDEINNTATSKINAPIAAAAEVSPRDALLAEIRNGVTLKPAQVEAEVSPRDALLADIRNGVSLKPAKVSPEAKAAAKAEETKTEEKPRSALLAAIRNGVTLKPTETKVKTVKKDPHLEAIRVGVKLKSVDQPEESAIPAAPSFKKVFKIDVKSEADQARVHHQQKRGSLLDGIAQGVKLKSAHGDVNLRNLIAEQQNRENEHDNAEKLNQIIGHIQGEKERAEEKENMARRNAATNAYQEQKIAEENIRQGLLPNGQPRKSGDILADIANFKLGALRKVGDRPVNPIVKIDEKDELQNHLASNLMKRRAVIDNDDDSDWD